MNHALFSTTEAAAILHVDPSRVRLLCKFGRIETIKVGNTYGIAEGELERSRRGESNGSQGSREAAKWSANRPGPQRR